MKKLVTILSVNIPNQWKYTTGSKKLIEEILQQTDYDIYVTTNEVEEFSDFSEISRVTIRTFDSTGLKFLVGNSFNYNLKFLALENLPHDQYDVVMYIDGDIKLDGWNNATDSYVEETMKVYDVLGTRFNCLLSHQIKEFQDTGDCLFKHKISTFDPHSSFDSKTIEKSRLPSEHFLFLRSDTRLDTFSRIWRLLNYISQQQGYETWGDGFEIGVSLFISGFTNIKDDNSIHQMGLIFNGNKY